MRYALIAATWAAGAVVGWIAITAPRDVGSVCAVALICAYLSGHSLTALRRR